MIADLLTFSRVGRTAAGMVEVDCRDLAMRALDTLEEVHEPFLIQEGYLARTAQGRILTPKGYHAIGLKAAAGSWQLIYRAARRFTLRAQSGEDSAVDVIWTWRWN